MQTCSRSRDVSFLGNSDHITHLFQRVLNRFFQSNEKNNDILHM